MIHINNHDTAGVYSESKEIVAVYSGLRLVWEKVKGIAEVLSCYHNGYWIDAYPWTDDTPWTD